MAKQELVESQVPTSVMDFDALVSSAANLAPWIGSGWTVCPTKEKNKLVGVPFVIVDIKERDGDFGPYFSLQCRLKTAVTIDGTETDRVVINDGSTGIYQQLAELMDQNASFPNLPYYVSHGLRVSEYMYKDDSGKEKPAATWYLDAR